MELVWRIKACSWCLESGLVGLHMMGGFTSEVFILIGISQPRGADSPQS